MVQIVQDIRLLFFLFLTSNIRDLHEDETTLGQQTSFYTNGEIFQ